MKQIKERGFSGVTIKEERSYEKEHRKLARMAATEGFVLLKNENNVLPLPTNSKIALYGSGAIKTIKGGTGSGDVNERFVVSVYEGMKKAGFTVTTEDWLKDYEKTYQKAREAWRDEIWSQLNGSTDVAKFFDIYSHTAFAIPAGEFPQKTKADTAVFVLSRVAGEGADRFRKPGDYYLSLEEEELLEQITKLYSQVIVLLNTGGIVDCSFLDKYEVDAVLLVSQPGMEAGNAIADVLSGQATPSGKLTDSWAYHYEDYPNWENYSHNNGNVEKEYYFEGIYVGYRYFDTFQIPVRYGFGFGRSYTDFKWEVSEVSVDKGANPTFTVKVLVTNTGKKYAGKEVVQVYVACPQKEQTKEYRRLVGFSKTKLLAPGEKQVILIQWNVDQMTSYEEKQAAWILESGCYGIYVGNCLEEAKLEASIMLLQTCIRSQLQNICPLQEDFQEMTFDRLPVLDRRTAMENKAKELPILNLSPQQIVIETIVYDKKDFLADSEEMKYVNTLTTDQLIHLATGDPGKVLGGNLGDSAKAVPGAAAETSRCAIEQGLDSLVLADGPAGLRLNRTYQVVDGQIIQKSFDMSIENGFLYRGEFETKGETYYQFCTAFPIGTLLAQSWDIDLLRQVGHAVGEEMNLFHVALWLAPGMNIHRNPLCGRNFEYYSEDPFVAGKMAAAITNGVQEIPGCGTTIKHFCCNNQEDNRMNSDSIVTERTLREIYLKGFEIAVKESQPFSIMTSYNLINGIHAANNYDTCTKVTREEWDYKGVIMTDWTTTHFGPSCTASGCMRAGNDLVMPGIETDHSNMKQELEDGTLSIDDLKRSISRLVHIIWKANEE